MDEIKFEGDSGSLREFEVEKPSAILGLVMKLSGGAIKTEQAAGWVIVVLVVVSLLVAFFVIPRTPRILPDEDMHTVNSENGKVYYPNVKKR